MQNQINHKLLVSGDGSHTLYIEHLNETYHSTHGAVAEAEHVFIRNGLMHLKEKQSISLLEVGMGTGLNVLCTINAIKNLNITVEYHAIEAFPLNSELVNSLNYTNSFPDLSDVFVKLHTGPWNQKDTIDPKFSLFKFHKKILEFEKIIEYDLMFYDAFGPRAQPEMWELPVLQHCFNLLRPGGIFVTYCAKGQVRRDLQQVGFAVERIPGPPGKREMLRATKSML